ncbi:hypothetical protein SAMN04244581_05137 [Paracoccus denitrificans]|jgi:hypothetical protein|uniref:Transposase n=1 Tax=Paracoccus denitrificans (strain Pd 1222) TaxID=318586 RepID=A1B6B2_PARDP|nr:hypothetical protein Pden_2972 [Paracoccus denitrificans PD1222]SDJ95367.1 hypothetical protein SAMN04244581_05137 [Paracoccus denitrificans]SFR23402.1 hypothetical protein SAMN04244569_05162 [Paracoccus denitrificans]
MHASLAITPEGLPLGLTAAKFWSRSKFKETTALKRKINPTRVPIEQKESMRWLDNLRLSTELAGAPGRCVHIGDRKSDIYELYCLAVELGTGFLMRSCVDRLAEDGVTTVSKVMAQIQSSGTHEVRFRDAQNQEHRALLTIRHATMAVRPPIGKQRKYRHQTLQIIHAEEMDPPEGRAPVFWKLITNLPVESHTQAVHKLDWYAPSVIAAACTSPRPRCRQKTVISNTAVGVSLPALVGRRSPARICDPVDFALGFAPGCFRCDSGAAGARMQKASRRRLKRL